MECSILIAIEPSSSVTIATTSRHLGFDEYRIFTLYPENRVLVMEKVQAVANSNAEASDRVHPAEASVAATRLVDSRLQKS